MPKAPALALGKGGCRGLGSRGWIRARVANAGRARIPGCRTGADERARSIPSGDQIKR